MLAPLIDVSRASHLARLGLLALLLAGTGCAWLDAKQRHIIYRPTPGMPADFAGLRADDERYLLTLPAPTDPAAAEPHAPPQRIELWWLPHPNSRAPTLLYLHGTFRNLFQNLQKIEALRHAGFAVLAVDYRGWGMSTPITPSEQTILQDAGHAWNELKRREPRASQRVIYGHSMGSGVAVDLASHLAGQADYGALILESAFTSFPEVADRAGVLASVLVRLNQERFASIDKIARVNAPLLMIHGGADDTIPAALGEKLFAAAKPPKRWLGIEGGGHSDLQQVAAAQYQATLHQFIADYLSGP